jgi:hypothetical protein
MKVLENQPHHKFTVRMYGLNKDNQTIEILKVPCYGMAQASQVLYGLGELANPLDQEYTLKLFKRNQLQQEHLLQVNNFGGFRPAFRFKIA